MIYAVELGSEWWHRLCMGRRVVVLSRGIWRPEVWLTRIVPVLVAAGFLFAAPLHAQQGQEGRGDVIPREYWPAAGMCRIWIEGVAPERQPESTDCPTALRRRPANARVVFGDEVRRVPALVDGPQRQQGLPVKLLRPADQRPPDKADKAGKPVKSDKPERPEKPEGQDRGWLRVPRADDRRHDR